jgi:hypothetical protein
MKHFIYTCFTCFIFAAGVRAEDQGSITDRYIALAIQGRLQPARALLDGLDHAGAEGDNRSERELAVRFRQRFIEGSEVPSPGTGNTLVDEVVTAYRMYWRQALLADGPQAGDQRSLEHALAAALRQDGPAGGAPPWKALFVALEPAIARQGYYALVSSDPRLHDLLVWRTQQMREFEVRLTDLTRRVQVAFLSDFASQGWKEYAALGLATTTGWVEGDTLYCVEWAYAPDTEGFEVSYLKHETRHLADFERFPGLSSAELEYRAKLTELAFASRTLRRLLEDFHAKSAPNPESPHAEANFRVVQDVYRALHGTELPELNGVWLTVDVGKVNRVARRLLEKNTGKLLYERDSRTTLPARAQANGD